jgi:hypothetical protein
MRRDNSTQLGTQSDPINRNHSRPTATTNSGLVARLEVSPRGLRLGQHVFHDQQVKHYIASDNHGNVAICSVNISVLDVTPRIWGGCTIDSTAQTLPTPRLCT